MEPTTDADEPEGESTDEEEKEEDSEEDEDRNSSDVEDVEEIASRENEGGRRVEGFLSALSKESLKPRKKVGRSFV